MAWERVLFTSLLIGFLCSPGGTAADQGRVIGISAPLTGEAATFGTDLRNVLIFANRKLAGNSYKIVIEDDRCEGKGAVTVAHKLLDIDKISAVFFACDTSALVTASIYGPKGVLVLTPLVTSPRFSHLGANFFRLAPNDADNARLLISYIAAHHKKLGILTEGASEYSEDLAQELERAAKVANLSLAHERFGPQTRDFKTLLLRLRAAGIDSIFINPTTEEPFLIALKELSALHINLPVYGAYTPGSSTFLQKAGVLADGIVFSDFPALPDLDSTGLALLNEFKAEFGPLNTWDSLFVTGFESFRVMHQAFESGLPPAEYIHKTTFKGLNGSYSFDKNGDIRGVRNQLRRVKKGETEPIPPSEFPQIGVGLSSVD